MIATIAEKKKVQRSQRSYGNHSPAIAATTIAEIKLFLSQRSLSLRSLESVFHKFAMITAIAELFFLSDQRCGCPFSVARRSDSAWSILIFY